MPNRAHMASWHRKAASNHEEASSSGCDCLKNPVRHLESWCGGVEFENPRFMKKVSVAIPEVPYDGNFGMMSSLPPFRLRRNVRV